MQYEEEGMHYEEYSMNYEEESMHSEKHSIYKAPASSVNHFVYNYAKYKKKRITFIPSSAAE